MKINWGLRLKNKVFWLTLIPLVLVLAERLGVLFGYALDLTAFGENIKGIIEIIFVILGLLGISVDPTTKGLSDSMQAMTYVAPRDDNEGVM